MDGELQYLLYEILKKKKLVSCQTFAVLSVLIRQVSWQEEAHVPQENHPFILFEQFFPFFMFHGCSSAYLLLLCVVHSPVINHCEQLCCMLKNTKSLPCGIKCFTEKFQTQAFLQKNCQINQLNTLETNNLASMIALIIVWGEFRVCS